MKPSRCQDPHCTRKVHALTRKGWRCKFHVDRIPHSRLRP